MKIFQALALAVLWIFAGGTAFILVKVLRIGPIIYTINLERGWGIHSGDFLALIPLLIALAVTVAVLPRRA